ncbi:DUF11 domain-containing protein [bacterium]|nr:DUF11 domain-containing protein [bacterium]
MYRSISRVLFVAALSVPLLLCQCTTARSGDRGDTVYTAPSQPAAQPAAQQPAPQPAVYTSREQLDFVLRAPETVEMNEPFTCELVLTARQDLESALVQMAVPAGSEFIDSTPVASLKDNVLNWRLAAMRAGQTETIRLRMRTRAPGRIQSCAYATVMLRSCFGADVTKPMIAIKKTGPAMATLGSEVTYTITVKNEGNAPARDVVIRDEAPQMLAHASGSQRLVSRIGTLAPGESKSINVVFRAAGRGRACNTAVVETSNAGTANDQACTDIVTQDLRINKSGPAEQFFNKRARYAITVENTGEVPLRDVSVVDSFPPETKLVEAPGASVSGNMLTWSIPVLEPGRPQSFNVTLTSSTPGSHCNTVEASSREGLRRKASACTVWRGFAAVLIEVVDVEDPLQVGEEETYIIKVTNQGTEQDTNVRIAAYFSPLIGPTSAQGPTAGTVQGSAVSFQPYRVLAPKQTITYIIKARAAAVGDSRLKVELRSDLLQVPVIEEESTHVY